MCIHLRIYIKYSRIYYIYYILYFIKTYTYTYAHISRSIYCTDHSHMHAHIKFGVALLVHESLVRFNYSDHTDPSFDVIQYQPLKLNKWPQHKACKKDVFPYTPTISHVTTGLPTITMELNHPSEAAATCCDSSAAEHSKSQTGCAWSYRLWLGELPVLHSKLPAYG